MAARACVDDKVFLAAPALPGLIGGVRECVEDHLWDALLAHAVSGELLG